MHISYGYRITVECDAPMPFVTLLDLHPDERSNITEPDDMLIETPAGPLPAEAIETVQDRFRNIMRRFSAPAGVTTLSAAGCVKNSGFADFQNPQAQATSPGDLPSSILPFLAGSRYCETDRLSVLAWRLFGNLPAGWSMVMGIVDYVHHRIRFDYAMARASRTALEAHEEGVGVCRDYAHLAVAFCRAMNIPARYCTGYLGDIGVPVDPNPMDFSAWFEAYLDGQWYTFDARHRLPRIGRIVMARGLDASDTAILTSFGTHRLLHFSVVTEEVNGARFPVCAEERRRHRERISTYQAKRSSSAE